jgi:hypothetical protein
MERTLLFHIQRKEDLAALAAKFARAEGATLVEQTDTLLHYVLSKDGSHLIYRTTLPPQVGALCGETAEAGEPLFPWLSMLTGYVVDDLAAGRLEMEAADLTVLQQGANWCLLIDPAKPVYGILLFAQVPELTLS